MLDLFDKGCATYSVACLQLLCSGASVPYLTCWKVVESKESSRQSCLVLAMLAIHCMVYDMDDLALSNYHLSCSTSLRACNNTNPSSLATPPA